jgi:hypothetical protein
MSLLNQGVDWLATRKAGVMGVPIFNILFAMFPAKVNVFAISFAQEINQAGIHIFHKDAQRQEPFNTVLQTLTMDEQFPGLTAAAIERRLLQNRPNLRA